MEGVTLGYLGFGVRDLDAWAAFATGVLGLEIVHRREDGGFSLRMDGHAWRIWIEPGDDDLAFVGWEAADSASLATISARLRDADVVVSPGDASRRGVAELVCCQDPNRVPLEIYCGPTMGSAPFVSPQVQSGFVADEIGLGHIVLSSQDNVATDRFYTTLLGFVFSDRIKTEIHGFPVDLGFYHAPGGASRHHSVAFGGRLPKRLHHFMLEVGQFDDVGLGFDRAIAAGVLIAQTLGRHPNDKMFSFYAHTPSGFQFEYGWGGRRIDDSDWSPTTYGQVSEWGHHPPGMIPRVRRKK